MSSPSGTVIVNNNGEHDRRTAFGNNNKHQSQFSVAMFRRHSQNNNNGGGGGGGGGITPSTLKPPKVLEATYKVGQFKASLPLKYLAVQSFMAGLFKSIGCLVYVIVGGGVLGAALFPVGLIAIVLTGAELFTGDLLVITVCLLSNKVTWYSLLRNLVVSWFMNFAGTLVWGSLIGYASGAVEDNNQVDFIVDLAERKSYMSWGSVFCKGIGANFLVCLALWQAMTAQEVASKILAIWFPIVAFVTVGLEHVVANMFFIPLGMMFGADVTVGRMIWWNLIPSTLGNVIGGAFGIALPFWFLFDPTTEQLELVNNFSDKLSNGVKKIRHTIDSSTHHGDDDEDNDEVDYEDDNQGTSTGNKNDDHQEQAVRHDSEVSL